MTRLQPPSNFNKNSAFYREAEASFAESMTAEAKAQPIETQLVREAYPSKPVLEHWYHLVNELTGNARYAGQSSDLEELRDEIYRYLR